MSIKNTLNAVAITAEKMFILILTRIYMMFAAQTKKTRSMNKIEKMNTGTVFECFRSKNILL